MTTTAGEPDLDPLDEVLADPLRCDLSRDADPHVGSGGGGPQFRTGTMLARTPLRQTPPSS